MKKRIAALTAALSLLLTGCGSLLEREWSSVTPHSAGYWENGDRDTLRADSYQDLVNALLLLVAEHAESGVIRIYGESEPDKSQMAADACAEVQQETDLGAYLLDYITYAGTEEADCYELTLGFGYRRTEEEQQAIINATGTDALPDLLRASVEEGNAQLAVRIGYFSTDAAGVEDLIHVTQAELSGAESAEALADPWEVSFYPSAEEPGIVEILLIRAR